MSNINPQNIDGTFPIAGQDNNSQGFRDNFTNTINNFRFAAGELTDLQTYAILASPLTSVGQTAQSLVNNMNYTLLTKPQLKGAVETINNFNAVGSGGSFTVDWSVAHFQAVNLTTSATMNFASTWPASNLWSKLRLQVTTTNTTTLTLPTTVTVNIATIQGYTSGTNLVLAAGTYVFEFSTYDNGSTVAIEDVLRNYTGTGAQVETGFQQFKPTANVAVTANIGINRVLLHPTGTVVSFGANVTLPNTQINGTIISISSNVTIASLSVVTPWVGSTVSPYGNTGPVTAGTTNRFMYVTADKIWYKIA